MTAASSGLQGHGQDQGHGGLNVVVGVDNACRVVTNKASEGRHRHLHPPSDTHTNLYSYLCHYYYASAPIGGGIKRCSCLCLTSVCLTSVCLSVAYIGPNLRTEGPRNTKFGNEVAHVTRDSDITLKVKRSKVNLLLMS